MSWEVKFLETNADAISSVAPAVITTALQPVSIDRTVGDEFNLKSGDLVLRVTAPLSFNSAANNWVLLYWKGTLTDVYKNEDVYEYNEKKGVYEYRMKSLQWVFFEELSVAELFYSATTNFFNYDLPNAAINITSITTTTGTGSTQEALNRFGFSLGDMIKGMEGKTQGKGFMVKSVTQPVPELTDQTIAYLFRGLSKSTDFDPIDDAVNWTFYYDLVPEPDSKFWGITWRDVFNWVQFGWNTFVKITPVLTFLNPDYELGLNIDIIPRTNVTPGAGAGATWLERTYQRERFRVDYVHISGLNFDYEQGSEVLGNKFERSIQIGDYDLPITNDDETLYWAKGNYQGNSVNGYPNYNPVKPWFESGEVEPYYDGMITKGHGYDGKIIFAGEGLLDQIQAGSDVIQLNRIVIDQNGLAEVEGIVI